MKTTTTKRSPHIPQIPSPCASGCGRLAIGSRGTLAYCEACWWLQKTMQEEGVRSFSGLERVGMAP